MLSQEIRRKFLEYFKNKGHTIVPSSSVVPHDDPTLLFTNAGMNQFKDIFLGKSPRDYKLAATAQKCIRVGGKHNDLDNVGHTSRHLTFFEMLGNFSFGDYFKKEAIAYAFAVTTEVFAFAPDKLWISVYEEDDEAFELWKSFVPESHIIRMGKKDNFWEMGATGPCGPCSELYYDRGSKYSSAPNPKEDPLGERYLEFWNLVFIQYNRDQQEQLHSLPNKSIDTGAGLERIISLKMGVDSVFHTDILRYLIEQIERISNKKYEESDASRASAFHVIADHIRALSFAIADGAQPSNIERGYVLRKILRRAVRYGRTLDLHRPFLANVLPGLIDVMGNDYRELISAKDRIAEVLTLEEENFMRTLKRGGGILNQIVEKSLKNPRKQISGEDAFKLKDTYGFPLEEILLIAKDLGLQVNIDSYQLLEEEAKEKSRSVQTVHVQEAAENLFASFVEKNGPTHFVGYADSLVETEAIGLMKEGVFVENLTKGEKGWILLKITPFYAEKGGQVGDTGTISHANGQFTVQDCQTPFPNVIVHLGQVEEGTFSIKDKVTAHIDEKKRMRIACHHTATHLLHWALQEVLGTHIRQAGSLVAEDRLRFDFNHHKAISPAEIRRIEDLVNERVRQNTSVNTYELPFEEIQTHPEIKQFFGEKYGAQVRVVDIDFSKELCGGTHVHASGDVGYFRIKKVGSIAAGIYRIEAYCGKAAEEFARSQEAPLEALSQLFKVPSAKIPEKAEQLLEENQTLKQQLRAHKRAELKQLAQQLIPKIEQVGKFPLLAQVVSIDGEDLLLFAEELQSMIPSGIVILALKQLQQAQLLIKVSPDLVAKGASASALIKQLAPLIGGGGGGRPESALAGGKRSEGIHEALNTAKELIRNL